VTSTPPRGDILLRVEHLSRSFGPLTAVEDVNFELHRGEVLGLLGPNGAGKSTTMRIISGNLAPDAGRVQVAGFDLIGEARSAKAQIGYLPEQPPLYHDMTVDEFLNYVACLNGVLKSDRREALIRVKERCGLVGAGSQLIGRLSKGYRQRVGIAQAIVHQPGVVILDEPTVGLDPLQIQAIRSLIRDLGHEHGVILSTHILPEVEAVCDRVQFIHKGRMVFAESMDRLRNASATSLVFAIEATFDAEEVQQCLDGIQVDSLEGGRFRVSGKPLPELARQVVSAASTRNWGLFELRADHPSLEQLFTNVVCREDAETGMDKAGSR